MQSNPFPTIAVIADAHLHDIYGDYDGASATIDGESLTLRSWADTRRSSRVFNESRMALLATLDGILARGIQKVVLLGDYSDDGQIESIDRVVDILRRYEQDYGIQFFAIPGNHDYYGPCGKHQSTRFSISATDTLLVTSDPETANTEPNSSVMTQKMYCPGAIDALEPMKSFGLTNRTDYLHWETPFGLDDDFNKRSYLSSSKDGTVSHQLTDFSYLVEPSEGLWLLMLDANVYEPRNGDWNITQKKAFLDSSDAGWNSLLRNKEFLVDWIRDVGQRAEILNKRLLAFSHYPAMDPFNDAFGGYEKLFGTTEIKRRQPHEGVAKLLLDAGISIHFGGHMHVNATNQLQSRNSSFTNVAVPSPVAFPPAYCVVEPKLGGTEFHNVSLNALPLEDGLMQFYHDEEIACGASAPSPALSAKNYGEFLYQRIHSRVEHRYLKRNWPEDIATQLKRTNTLDLVYLLVAQDESDNDLSLNPIGPNGDENSINAVETLLSAHSLKAEAFASQPMMELLMDWYCLRDAGDMALPFIGPEKLQRYRFLATQFGDASLPTARNHQTFFRIFLSLLSPH